MQMYTRFGGRLSQGQNLASNRKREREENITVDVCAYSFCCGAIQLKHECALNQHDSGENKKKVMQVIQNQAEANPE